MIPPFPELETTPVITDLIAHHAPVAIGVSGGKDSDVAAFEVKAYLEAVGHKGPVLLIHSDLGRIEHKDSLPTCERLASRLGLDLIVVRRKAGDLMDRWLVRWQNNVERYSQLLCVKLILPWSTPSMRFCTSELKTAIICRDLVERYPRQMILSVSGIRRQESTTRALAPICAPQSKLTSKTFGTQGYDWYPLLPWTLEQVLAYHQYCSFPLHEAYTKYGMSRVSCAYCILAGLADLIASATNPETHDIYREMVALEVTSAFSFQSGRWLGDVAPHLLSEEMLAGLKEAKRRAAMREQIERRIPSHLQYKKGWPTVMPTYQEAVLLSEARRTVADLMHFMLHYIEPDAILDRYAELMAKSAAKRGGKVTPAEIQPLQQSLWNVEVCA
jgi:3'-phosphoadenosine 5'-phosphosulfate sulfotransferase (PAPS reductase)/FAD synthetase